MVVLKGGNGRSRRMSVPTYLLQAETINEEEACEACEAGGKANPDVAAMMGAGDGFVVARRGPRSRQGVPGTDTKAESASSMLATLATGQAEVERVRRRLSALGVGQTRAMVEASRTHLDAACQWQP